MFVSLYIYSQCLFPGCIFGFTRLVADWRIDTHSCICHKKILKYYPLTDVNEKEEEKSKLKQLYIKFYQQLVEAVSDSDTCHSLTTQLHSTSFLSEEKKAALRSSLASGSSYLKVLGVEEEPHLLINLCWWRTCQQLNSCRHCQKIWVVAWLCESKQGN